jgi:hypothetical protein
VWRPAAAARNRAPGGPGPRPPGTTTWLRGASLHGLRRKCRRRKRGPRPKIAKVERREASASIARRASRPLARQLKTMRLSALRHPLRVEARFQAPGRKTRRGNEWCCSHGLFDIVRRERLSTGLMLRSIAASRASAVPHARPRCDASRSMWPPGSGPPSSSRRAYASSNSSNRLGCALLRMRRM